MTLQWFLQDGQAMARSGSTTLRQCTILLEALFFSTSISLYNQDKRLCIAFVTKEMCQKILLTLLTLWGIISDSGNLKR